MKKMMTATTLAGAALATVGILGAEARMAAPIGEVAGEPGRDPVYGHGVLRPGDACRLARQPSES